MKTLFLAAGTALSLSFAAAAFAQGPSPELVASVDIPFEKFTLSNGLTVITHTDRKAPIVAVSVWYHVGSKDEPEGRTGFAHLFEHLMFNGSENYDDEWFKALQEMGATDYNGTTWFDRTNYFQNVPTPALERMLFLESDRMGHLLGAVTQEKLDAQRGVVQNEKRQGDNRPFGKTEYRILEGLFPKGHPYRHSTIGSMADLDAASLEDVQSWFKQWYGPNNAVLVLAGDIDAATARPLVEKYFGDIPAGPALEKRLKGWVPKRENTVREVMEDDVANSRVYRAWAAPGLKSDEVRPLSIAAAILAGGESSRLYKALVRDAQIATGVSGGVQPLEAVGMLQLSADVKPGVDPALVESMIDAEIERFRREGPTEDEVERVAMRVVSGTIRGLEDVGGFGGKAVTLAEGEVYTGDPGFFKTELTDYVEATRGEVQAAAQAWMGAGGYQLLVTPVGDLTTTAGVDRSELPTVGDLPKLDFPDVERATLGNGIEVTFARRASVPVVNISMVFDAGDAADPKEKPGTQALTLSLLDEGTADMTGIEIAEAEERLGASIGAGSDLDTTTLSLSALSTNLAASLDLYADVVRNPAFDEAELERVRGIQLARIDAEMKQPNSLALRLLPPLIYGEAHPYGAPLTGTGTPDGVKAVTRSDLVNFHSMWLRPDNAAIFVVGDTTLAEIVPMLEARFGNWEPQSPVKGVKLFTPVSAPESARIVLVDRPGAPQSFIFAGYPLQAKGTDDNVALSVANIPLGGIFTSRLNTNLREEKGWSYGVRTTISGAVEQQPFYVTAPVQTDKTGEALAELRRELTEYVGDRMITSTEVSDTTAFLSGRLPGAYESAGAVMGAILGNAKYGRPDDYQETYAQRLSQLTEAEVAAAAAAEIDPNKLLWVIVGDADLVRPQLEGLGLPIEER
ncbi:insulinase family protein [Pacificimonas sp. WHA3]|uniref:Insulinase family protein n=1 Tax=Pacificimonas pallii TaxID=2827236 RepID=A0ABS6SC23_9SPHN|nr:pitrilysin family protein [Pacificimonas pallii]MBV7255959.1 insulinase family protein [Pacificimonas pallii]